MSSPEPAENRVVAGRYRLRHVVGRGGMGVLWAARDEMLSRDVAVKEIRPPVGAGDEHDALVRERALREARAAARVTHPSAVTVYDVVEEDGRPWIVMELLPSRTLADVLAVDGPMTPAAVARIGLDLLDALTAAHDAGVLHRDVKPGNVLFADGRAVLVDFGIAMVDGDASLTSAGLLLGSPAFMAPERARGERPTPASDLWSLGATLFTAVEGESPFRRDGQLPTLAAVVTQDAPPAEHAGPLRPLLAALLARDPAARPTAAEARTRILEALSAADAATTAALELGSVHVLDPHDDPYDDPYDDLEPTAAASPVDLDLVEPADRASESGVLTLLAGLTAAARPSPRSPWLPRQRRTRALAAALLTPVGLFALVLGWPAGHADPITSAPRAVVSAPDTTSATPSRTTATHTPVGTTAANTTAQRPASTGGSAAARRTVEPRATDKADHGDGGKKSTKDGDPKDKRAKDKGSKDKGPKDGGKGNDLEA